MVSSDSLYVHARAQGQYHFGNLQEFDAAWDERMRVGSDVECLRRVPLFAEVNPAHLQLLVFSASRRKIKKGDYIFQEGKKATNAFVVLEGKIQLSRGSGEDKILIAEALPGALIGETSMLAGTPFSVSALAISDAIVLQLTRKLLFEVAEEFPDFAFKLTKAVSARLDANLNELDEVKSALCSAPSWSGE